MKNKIDDLRNHLFAELERLGDEDLEGAALEAEIARARAINGVASNLIDSAKVEVEYLKVTDQTQGSGFLEQPAEAKRLGGRS